MPPARRGKSKIRKCLSCLAYTLREECPKCGKRTIPAPPPDYSPKDPHRLIKVGLI
ncbi:MAG: ribosome biogenesis protein [Thermoproteota archaeon]|nr:MAG: ribosome biogenesis protein [Candidatus Korarchaeota archaeon]